MSSPLPLVNNYVTGSNYTPAEAVAVANAVNAMGLVVQTVQTANYSAPAGSLTPVNASSGPVIVTLPNAPLDTTHAAVFKNDSSANAVTIAAAGLDVFYQSGGPVTVTLLGQYPSIVFQYAATTKVWYPISWFGGSPTGNVDGGTP